VASLSCTLAASEEFQEWLDVQSHFHDYSHRNSLLIKLQCSEATKVAGYRTWQEEFDRHVREGEQAIWIWAPIIAKQCPDCGNSPSYHENSDCEYDETPPEEWSKGLVGFKPTAVFDVSQTEGEPLPDLDTEAVGESTPSNANSTSDSTASRRSSNSLNRVTLRERSATTLRGRPEDVRRDPGDPCPG